MEPRRPPTDGLVDPESGLFNEAFFSATLSGRLTAARRHLRPIAVALLDLAVGRGAEARRPADPEVVAAGMHATLRGADILCRLDDGRYAVVLEDTSENGAVWSVERLRRRLVSSFPDLTLWAGVSCYPAHAFDAEALLRLAEQALRAAREWQQDRIEVAASD